MALSSIETQAVADLTDVLYSFLPGKPHPYGNQRLSFPAAAADAGVGQLWDGGSKSPAIAMLLRRTLTERRGNFCTLITCIVNAAIIYRRGKREPITRTEMEKVNGAVQRIGFKIPELWDENFLSSLVQAGASEPSPKVGSNSAAVAQLKTDLLDLAKMSAQERGYAFERFLNHLFEAFQMTPRTPFRNRGEQIDGSFADERDYYLLEAKWQAEKVGVADLRSFLGAVESKAEWSRGCFVSYSGFSEDGLYAFGKGRSTRIICIDATDLWHVVDGKVDLRELIRKKIRHAAEHGEAFVPARDLFTNII